MRLDRSKLPHNMTPEQRADMTGESLRSATKRERCDLLDSYEAEEAARAVIAWLTKGWNGMDAREKQALASGALV